MNGFDFPFQIEPDFVSEVCTDDGHKMDIEWIKDKARCGQYSISEHVVRFLMAGKISVPQIEEGIRSGKIIEIHKNPKRQHGFLVFGNSAGKPVHVMCADGGNDCLLVLFAYVPALPIWENPLKRSGRGDLMGENLRACYFCGGRLRDIMVGSFDYRLEGQLYVIKKVPAALCEQCGEKYISAEAARKINDQIAASNYTETEQVHVHIFE